MKRLFSDTLVRPLVLGVAVLTAPGAWSNSTPDWAYVPLDAAIEADMDMAAFIEPYRQKLEAIMDRPLTTSTAVMPVEKPESSLGNWMADILRHEANAAFDAPVDVALMNGRGLRITLPEGTIRVRTIYELMPFENHIALLQFTGEQLATLANEIARYGGEPVSGIRFLFYDGVARAIEVGGTPLDPERLYWLATNNWMANGGGALPTLWEPQQRVDLPVLIREAFIAHLEEVAVLEPRLDGRIQEVAP